MAGRKPRITTLVWNLVDPPWSFYSIRYILDEYSEHIVYIPQATIEEELKTQDIVQIVVAKLRALLDCDPVHVDRITEETKVVKRNETRRAVERSPTRSRLD